LGEIIVRQIVLVLLAVVSLAASFASAEEAKVKKVLYLGLDGCRFDAIEKAETPNLDLLRKQGVYSRHNLILGERYRKNDTVSGPGWSTIYTGVWADKHGVHDNSFKGSNYADYPHFFHRVKETMPQTRCVSFVTWKPIQEKIVSHSDVNEIWEDSSRDYAKYDASATEAAVKEIAENDPTVVVLYIGQIDETGHKHGFHPTVPQYLAAIERADKHVGSVLAAIKARKTYDKEDWLVVVNSDHGGKGTNHGGGHNVPEILNSFLIVSGNAAQRGEFAEPVYLVDAVPTILTFLGIKIDEAWKLDGKAVGLK
jgi:arylsulfatase A-like enzyme